MATPATLASIRRQAVHSAITKPTTLARAVTALGFVQADPIQSPARAQDLILFHRVTGYRAGDLEHRFPGLGIEEDYLYAYGFMPQETACLLHPRHDPDSPGGRHRPFGLAAEVYAFVREQGPTHPTDLEARFGRERAVNGWGGFSKATTRALQSLHYHGLLRVARRRDGIRIYEATAPRPDPLDPAERLRNLVLLVLRILAPIPETSLAATFRLLADGAPGLDGWRPTIAALIQSGELETATIDEVRYLWPATTRRYRERDPQVRFLTPFDPLVWDRRRFQHLWGWAYRFEAYTPPAKRQLGYYAMPLLWGDQVIGWANLTTRQQTLDVSLGFIDRRPKSRVFQRELDAEIARAEAFLGLPAR